MKKLLALALSLALCTGLSAPVFAAEEPREPAVSLTSAEVDLLSSPDDLQAFLAEFYGDEELAASVMDILDASTLGGLYSAYSFPRLPDFHLEYVVGVPVYENINDPDRPVVIVALELSLQAAQLEGVEEINQLSGGEIKEVNRMIRQELARLVEAGELDIGVDTLELALRREVIGDNQVTAIAMRIADADEDFTAVCYMLPDAGHERLVLVAGIGSTGDDRGYLEAGTQALVNYILN